MSSKLEGYLWILIGLTVSAVLALVVACGGDAEDSDGAQPVTPVNGSEDDLEGVGAIPPNAELVLVINSEDIGAHLVPTGHAVDLGYLLESSDDPHVVALPLRATADSGQFFEPSLDSPTDESFWVHVFTDVSEEAAREWVQYVAAQPPSLAHLIVPHHDLFDAGFQTAPAVGEAAVSIALLHGHSGGCWRSDLAIFAQAGAIVFLRNSIEVPRLTASGASGASEGPCDSEHAPESLSDINAIAELISERLQAPDSDNECADC